MSAWADPAAGLSFAYLRGGSYVWPLHAGRGNRLLEIRRVRMRRIARRAGRDRARREALGIAVERDEAGHPIWFDVMIGSILRSSDLAGRLVEAVLGPLRRQDEGRESQLEATLTAYVDSGFSTAATARAVSVHANTIVYRLGRIHELTGRDPRNPHDLASLALAVRSAKLLEARRGIRRGDRAQSDPPRRSRHLNGDSYRLKDRDLGGAHRQHRTNPTRPARWVNIRPPSTTS